MSIKIDYTSILEETLGAGKGLNKDDFDKLQNNFKVTLDDLSKRRQNRDLPFWDLPFNTSMINDVEEYSSHAKNEFKELVHLGIGGSALGPIALHATLNHLQHNLLPADKRNGCRFFCPDNVDPDLIQSIMDVIDPRETLFHIVTKSGSTSETISQFLFVVDVLKREVGDSWAKHLVITTDPEKGFMRDFANKHGVQSFSIEPKVGGRFTILTPVGLLPAAVTGIDISKLCEGARGIFNACFNPELMQNPAALLASSLYLADVKCKLPMQVFFAYSNRLYLIADWFRQLWAESLGKKNDLNGNVVNCGPTPIKAVGATDQHSQVQLYVEGPEDKVVVFMGTSKFGSDVTIPNPGIDSQTTDYLSGNTFETLINTERAATSYALSRIGRANLTIEMDRIDERHVGALLYLMEAAVLYAGALYHVNPLDQPGVEAGKKATYALMGREGFDDERKEIEQFSNQEQKSIALDL